MGVRHRLEIGWNLKGFGGRDLCFPLRKSNWTGVQHRLENDWYVYRMGIDTSLFRQIEWRIE